MVDSPPVVYILHGDDEYAIARFLSELESKLGDPAMAAMNITRLDGRTYNLDELLSVATTLPFLAKRRLVILTHPLVPLTSKSSQEKLLGQLAKIPHTTAMVLVEYSPLTSEKERRNGRLNWLEKWALAHQDIVLLREFPLPKGESMVRWIQDQAKRSGGQLTTQAAQLLASLVGGNPRLADQEIQKVLAYVNYQRPVEMDDVEVLVADAGQGDIFVLVDSVAVGDRRKALGMLHRLLEYQESISIFGMIVRQFRLLLLTRELLDHGQAREDIIRKLDVAPFLADKLILQARRFTLPFLEAIYHRLLEVDEAMKTSQIPGDLAMETLVVALGAMPERPRTTR